MSSRPGFRLASIPLAIAATFGTGLVHAQQDSRYYVAPMATYVLADTARSTDDALGGTLALGVPLASSVEFELRATYLKYKADQGGADDTDITAGGFAANLFLKGPGGPYLHGDVMGFDDTLYNLGLGWDLKLSESFGIRAEALYHWEAEKTDEGHDFKEPLFNLGLRIPFGRQPAPPPPPAPVEVIPAAPPPPPPVCGDGLDNDNDGDIDFPADKGCTALDDGDETDPAPRCKPPEPGQAMSLEGCGVGDVIVLRGVNFEFDKSTLTVNARSILDGVAAALTARPDIKIELGGHTDGKGSDEYNARLSDRRSKSVKAYLVQKGVASSRMTTRGYGESMPVATNDTDDGREFNRRVELKVTESAGGVTVAPPVPTDAAPAAPAAPAAASATAVTIADFAFSPATLTVPVGSTVVWTNQDGSSHLVRFSDAGSERLKKGTTYTRTFTAPGSYPYECGIHPRMTGTVVVQ